MYNKTIRFFQVLRVSAWALMILFLLAILIVFFANQQLVTSLAEKYQTTSGVKDIRLAIGCFIFLGIAGGLIAQHIFKLILDIVRAAGQGQPFVGKNADRLRSIGWALLAIQVLTIGTRIVAYLNSDIATDTLFLSVFETLDFVSLIAAILIFVLAQIFEHGAEMRQELEETV
jgi:Protein of unknown function (DUF2975)